MLGHILKRQGTQPFAQLCVSQFFKLEITNRNPAMGPVAQNGKLHAFTSYYTHKVFFQIPKNNHNACSMYPLP
jgi:hypothetical protein